jgi:hypothetical protein
MIYLASTALSLVAGAAAEVFPFAAKVAAIADRIGASVSVFGRKLTKRPPWLMALALTASVSSCGLIGPAVGPGVKFVSCVVENAAQGRSLADIVDACGGDVADVIRALASNPGSTPAHYEAARAKAVK